MSSDKALAIIPSTVDEVTILSERFSKSALIPADLRGKSSDVFVTLLAGQELGLPPMASLRGIHVVKGKPILSADAMVGVVMGRGIAEYFRCVSADETSATYETKRHGAPEPQRCTWTIEDAKRAGLTGKDTWKSYPRQLLKARCKAELARDVYPDVLAGCYEDSEGDELEVIDVPARASVDIEPESDFDTDGAIFAMRDAETVEDLRRLAASFGDAPEKDKDRLRAAYRDRAEELRAAVVKAVTDLAEESVAP